MSRNRSGDFRRRAACVAAVFAASLSCAALAQTQVILAHEVIEPRTFGYVVGDKVRREVYLSLRPDYRLDQASLPKAGRLDRWLELAEPEIRVESITNGRRYHLVLSYQIFNAPLAPDTITIPQHNLRVLGTKNALSTLVPALRITVAPVTSAVAANGLSGLTLQQDRPPAPIPLGGRQTRLAVAAAALLALLLLAAWRRGFAAFVARRNLPFTKASRELQRLQRTSDSSPSYAQGLKVVHEAVNSTAGRAVFAHNLDEFLAVHSAYAGLRTEFHRLFAASGKVFFADAGTDAPSGSAWPSLQRLCRLCSKIERRSFDVRSSEKVRESGT
jgi:mxaA protein